MAKREIDQISGTETTGHEWDGIKELDTPLPRWWVWTLYLTIIWAIGYVIAYPAIPLINGNTKGLLGYSSRADVAKEITMAKAAQGKFLDRVTKMSVDEIRKDSGLFSFAVAGGSAAFKVNCVQCHGAGAQGAPGYPNLNDDDWLWGGKLADIETSIRHGIRFAEDDDTRVSDMPAFGADEVLDAKQISDVAEFTLKISSQDHDAAAATRGEAIFAENCVACHGEDGGGLIEIGGPNLKDAIWFYGNKKEQLVAQINRPKQGVMPAWNHRLDDATIKQLTLYIHALGGGK